MAEAVIMACATGFGAAALALAFAFRRTDLAIDPQRLARRAGALGAVAGLALALLAPGADWRAALLLATLAPLALIDAEQMLLPDDLTLPLIVAGLVLGAVSGAPAQAALGALLGWGALALFARLWPVAGALGAGDAKMLGGIGSFLGPSALPEVIFVGAVSGAIFMLWRRGARSAEAAPFGPALALGALASLLFGPIF